jgi:carboxylesterase
VNVAGARAPLGVLILHGFSAGLATVAPLGSALEALGVPVRVPLLRGHGAESPESLRGVGWRDWVADGSAALDDLLALARRAVVVGHSMGALVALVLAAGRPGEVDSLCLAGAALELDLPVAPGRPFAFAMPLIERIFRDQKLHPDLRDPAFAHGNPNYPWVPTRAVMELFDLVREARRRLGEVRAPALILHGRRDGTAAPEGARAIIDGISTPAAEKRIAWFDRTGHQMFLGVESEAVIATILAWVREREARVGSL